MASSSSTSSSSPEPYTGEWEYDVFLCFRGGDIGNSFLSHLKQAMLDKKIRVLVDTMLKVTQDDMAELLRILERTAVSVVIFSSQFADSILCLDQVHTIAQSVQNLGHRALPIFYDVDWTTVAGDYHWFHDFKSALLSCFCTCFLPHPTLYAKTIAGLEATPKMKQEWMKSLKAVASKTGRTSESFPVEARLIEEVVAKILTTLATMSSGIQFDNLVGIDLRISEVERLLTMDDLNAIRVVGLWGMGGLGKSTLARTCYERLKTLHKEEMKFHFVEKINETCSSRSDKSYLVEGLVQEMYSTLLSESCLTWDDVTVDYRRARLSHLRVFVVLDDVQTPLQMEQFFLRKASNLLKLFSKGSRIIITSRNRRVLDYMAAEIYPVEHLNDVESLKLFNLHAFRPGSVQDDRINNKMLHEVITYCKGNPLALKVLGGRLLPKGKTYWESFLCKLGQTQEPGIHYVLRRSYDELGDDDKRLFLDIACFFSGSLKSLLVKYVETSYSSSLSSIEDLMCKSLLISTADKTQGEIVVAHSLLREMAWNIVNEEENIGQRTRLKDPSEIRKLLTIREGDRATQGIHLDLSRAENMCLKANAFSGMESLRWLDLSWPKPDGYGNRKIEFSDGDLNSLPNTLRGLRWDQFPSTSLPAGFSPKKLAYLVITRSPIEKCWKRDQPKLEHLMLLNLSDCENLTTIPNLFHCSNLEYLLLRGCKSLFELPETIQSLVKLVALDARDCEKLESVPSRLNSKSLKQLLLSNCPNLTRCPEVNSVQLQVLELDGTPIISLPESISKFKQNGDMVSRNFTRLELLC